MPPSLSPAGDATQIVRCFSRAFDPQTFDFTVSFRRSLHGCRRGDIVARSNRAANVRDRVRAGRGPAGGANDPSAGDFGAHGRGTEHGLFQGGFGLPEGVLFLLLPPCELSARRR